MIKEILFFDDGVSKKINQYNCISLKSIKRYTKFKGEYVFITHSLESINIEELNSINKKIYDLYLPKSKVKSYYYKNLIYNIDPEKSLCFFDTIDGILIKSKILNKYNFDEKDQFELYKFLTKAVKSVGWSDIELSSNNAAKININYIDKYFEIRSECKYNFIYIILKEIIYKFYEWDIKTMNLIISKFNRLLLDVKKEEFYGYIKYRELDDNIQMLKILLLLIRENDIMGIKNLSKLFNEKNKLIADCKKNELKLERMKKLVNKDRMKAAILLDKIITKFRSGIAKFEYIVSKPFFAHKDIWLIGERNDQAEDNAYVFFKYCRENRKDLNIFYLIDKNSKQVENVNKLGNVIYLNSKKHKYYLMHSKNIISAYDFENFLLPKDSERFKRYYGNFIKANRIFLQHGVALNKANYYNKYINKYDYILISTIKEYNMFTKEYGYNDKNLLKIGLARYDNLKDLSYKNKEKNILFMPTWRSSIVDLNDDMFKETSYYKSIKSLITNEKLLNILKQNNIKLSIYLHYQMQGFLHLFKFKNDSVEFLNKENSIVQELLNDSDLLITDFSSVGVDFSYLNKPVIFYQFSHENFHYDINYEKKYTLYSDFGKVTKDEDVVIELIELWKNNNYKNFYKINPKLFYRKNDVSNCERIYEFISKLNKKKLEDNKIIFRDSEGNINEERIYDYNYNFKRRVFFKKNIKDRELIYNNGYIKEQLLFTTDGQVIKRDFFYKNIKIDTRFYDIHIKSENKLYKHDIAYNGELKNKEIIDTKNNRVISRNTYDFKENKIKISESYYGNGKIKSYLEYNSDRKPIKYIYYNKNGIRQREYTYYKSGKVKEKMFFDDEGRRVIKRVILSEIENEIIKEIEFDKAIGKYKEIIYKIY